MKFKLLLMVLSIVLLLSCKNNVEELYNCNDDISYIQTIRPIIDASCMECHNGDDSSIPDWTTYQEIKNYADRIQELTHARIMPEEGSLTDDEIKSIYCWVEQGALNN